MKAKISIITSIVIVLFLAACDPVMGLTGINTTPDGPMPKPPDGENVVFVTPVYDGPNQVNISIGKILVVQIPTIPQEGFDWVLVDHDASMLVLEGEGTYIEDTSEDSAGGVVEFRFDVVGPGESSLTFDYRNEAQGMSSNSFGLTVNVEGSSQNRVVITPDPSGPQKTTLKVGDVLVVELPTIPDEGFAWVVPYLDTAILKQIGDAEYIPDSAEGSAGGVTRLQFEAVGAGETSLAVEYAKMSEDTSEMITSNSFGMTIIVE